MTLAEIEQDRGNVAEVLRALGQQATARAELVGELNAEHGEGSAQWHVATVHPGHENIAAAHLAARRFGVYVPMIDDVAFLPQGKRRSSKRMFPGYVFLFVWDVALHLGRIHACPGVARVLFSDPERPAVISDSDMEAIQAAEARSIAEAEGLYWRGKKRPRGKRREPLPESDLLKSSPRCYFSNIESLDDHGRVGVLHKALGLLS